MVSLPKYRDVSSTSTLEDTLKLSLWASPSDKRGYQYSPTSKGSFEVTRAFLLSIWGSSAEILIQTSKEVYPELTHTHPYVLDTIFRLRCSPPRLTDLTGEVGYDQSERMPTHCHEHSAGNPSLSKISSFLWWIVICDPSIILDDFH